MRTARLALTVVLGLLGGSAASACGDQTPNGGDVVGDAPSGPTNTTVTAAGAPDPSTTMTSTQDFPEPDATTALLSDRDGNRYFVVALRRIVAVDEAGGVRLSIPVRLTNPRSSGHAPIPRKAGYFLVGATKVKVPAELVADSPSASLSPGDSIDAVLLAADVTPGPIDTAAVQVWLQILDQGTARAFNGVGLPLPEG